jgi:TetR/AcrR family transcriptional regulator, fatty acid metabolism regulator protein
MTTHAATPSLKERQRQERERLILRAAGEVLADQGYDGMSMEDVASRVGISRAAIYLHFPSKEDLVFALLGRGIQMFAESVDDIFASGLTPREKVRAIIEHSYGGMAQPSFRFFNAVLQSPTFLSKMTERQRTMRDVWNPIQQRLTDVLDEGKRSGDFDAEMPTSLMVSLLSGLLTPFTFKQMVEQEGMPLPEVVNFLSRYFLKGIAPSPRDDLPETRRPAY